MVALKTKRTVDGFHEQKEEEEDETMSDILRKKNEVIKMRREFTNTSACVRALIRSNFVDSVRIVWKC